MAKSFINTGASLNNPSTLISEIGLGFAILGLTGRFKDVIPSPVSIAHLPVTMLLLISIALGILVVIAMRGTPSKEQVKSSWPLGFILGILLSPLLSSSYTSGVISSNLIFTVFIAIPISVLFLASVRHAK